ncbi:hypothetical protein B0H14DRAFT_2629810 [Mycena olivaceomarginata]|nr:hypothetical protein B0H14DRAFT_2629810 [Mycena olivaceomarginata]
MADSTDSKLAPSQASRLLSTAESDEVMPSDLTRLTQVNFIKHYICRQHGYKVPLDLETEKDLEVPCEGLKSRKAHLAGKVTVAAFRMARRRIESVICVGRVLSSRDECSDTGEACKAVVDVW